MTIQYTRLIFGCPVSDKSAIDPPLYLLLETDMNRVIVCAIMIWAGNPILKPD